MENLKECPFCGNNESLRIVTPVENNEIEVDINYKAVCCDFIKGGCGACSGYFESEQEAIKHWGERCEVKDISLENAPCHANYNSNCCGIFNKIVEGNLICNECGRDIMQLLEGL